MVAEGGRHQWVQAPGELGTGGTGTGEGRQLQGQVTDGAGGREAVIVGCETQRLGSGQGLIPPSAPLPAPLLLLSPLQW